MFNKKNLLRTLSVFLCLLCLVACSTNGGQLSKGEKENNQSNTSSSDDKAVEKDIEDKIKSMGGQFFFLNSILTLDIYDTGLDNAKINQEVEDRVRELENKMSTKIATSEVSKINDNAGIDKVKVSDDTFTVIKEALKYGKISKGKFDITVGNLVDLWGIGTENEKVPSKEEIQKALATVDYNKVEIDDNNKTVFLKDKGMKIDLGAIAKGYVADDIVKILEKDGVKSAIINLGGNVYVYGNKGGKNFKIGIRNPLSPDPNDYLGIYQSQNESVVTSGVYERFFEKDGKRYHHILSTSDGYPIDNNLISTSIITKSSMDADALSTTTFALGLEEGLKLIENTKNTEAMFITADKKIYMTSGLKEKFELKNSDFTIEK
ncbi:thiamine biosynthesis lipoprotein [[Eubacterium] yurii]|nr:thiamine biosynthesis lipoprotein [[Eubacterium] yurii]